MQQIILDGKSLANKIILELKNKITLEKRPPKLLIIQVGNDRASNSYIKQKQKFCACAGMNFELKKLTETTTETELINLIELVNADINTDGFLVQLPLPKHICPKKIAKAVDPTKDVDGFHPENLGQLYYNNTSCLAPCTPLGIIMLLEHYHVKITGKNIAVVGASTIVGQPLATMLTQAGATVTLCHKLTKKLPEIIAKAEILVSATGNRSAINTNDITNGTVVIDVGINFTPDGKISGDLDQKILQNKAGAYTPVPGGVGPMTVAALLLNTYQAFLLNLNAK